MAKTYDPARCGRETESAGDGTVNAIGLPEVHGFPDRVKGEIMFSVLSPFLPVALLAALLGMLAVGSFVAAAQRGAHG
jgi:hypothetical protein